MRTQAENDLGGLRFSHPRAMLSFADFDTFVDAARHLVEEVTKAVTGTKGDWVITGLKFGSAAMQVSPLAITAESHDVSRLIFSGISMVEHGIGKPPFFSDKALKSVGRLGRIAEKDVIDVSLLDDSLIHGEKVHISKSASDHISHLLAAHGKYYGSLVGNLDTVSVHRRNRIVVYGELGDVATCFLDEEILEQAKELLGERVVVSGLVSTNRLGNMVSIKVEELYQAPKPSPKSIATLFGSIPDMTGSLSIPAYLAEGRKCF